MRCFRRRRTVRGPRVRVPTRVGVGACLQNYLPRRGLSCRPAYAYSAYTKIASRELLLAAPTSAVQSCGIGSDRSRASIRAARIFSARAPLDLDRDGRDASRSRRPPRRHRALAGNVARAPLHIRPANGCRPAGASGEISFFMTEPAACVTAPPRFVLAEDRRGTAFTFAPLQADAFATAIASDRRAALPDSVVVKTEDGKLLTRSDAVTYILQRLGGLWRVIAAGLALAPRGMRDAVYNFIARIRYRLFAREADSCPVLPPELRSRFRS